jgi:hypothetical protein
MFANPAHPDDQNGGREFLELQLRVVDSCFSPTQLTGHLPSGLRDIWRKREAERHCRNDK